MTSCCSVANLTLMSGAVADADGKRAWALLGGGQATSGDQLQSALRWSDWGGALKDAGCSAGAEGQDPQSATPGLLDWFNSSVCGERA